MPDESYLRIPLRRRDGTIRAHAIIDAEDAHLAVHRWSLDRGYAKRNLPRAGGKQRLVLLHREVLGLAPGDGHEVDHIDGDRLNCRRSNMRIATHAQNGQNRASRPGSSPYRGVSWETRRGKWLAQAMLNGVKHNLGCFDDELEAAAVARAWRTSHMTFTNEERVTTLGLPAAATPTHQR